jgi:hypothetical protein
MKGRVPSGDALSSATYRRGSIHERKIRLANLSFGANSAGTSASSIGHAWFLALNAKAGENSLHIVQGADDFADWKRPFSHQCWRDKNNRSSISDERRYSRLPNIAHTAGIVVTSPTTARVAPTALRFSPSRSAKNRAIPAPRKARVTMTKASSGRVSLISFTIVQIV